MKHKRWYDKKENLRTIVESLQNLDPNVRNTFTLDIIQFAIDKQADKDTFLEVLNNEITANGKRWYDDIETVQSAIEMLKYLPDEEVEELFKDTIFSMIHEYKNNEWE